MVLATELGNRRKQLLSLMDNCDEPRGITPTKLTEKCHLSKSAVAYHLRKLEERRLVTSVKVGRNKYFDITEHGIEAMQVECKDEIMASCGSCGTGYSSFEQAKKCCVKSQDLKRKTGDTSA